MIDFSKCIYWNDDSIQKIVEKTGSLWTEKQIICLHKFRYNEQMIIPVDENYYILMSGRRVIDFVTGHSSSCIPDEESISSIRMISNNLRYISDKICNEWVKISNASCYMVYDIQTIKKLHLFYEVVCHVLNVEGFAQIGKKINGRCLSCDKLYI